MISCREILHRRRRRVPAPVAWRARHAYVDLVGADIGGIEDAAIPLRHGHAHGT